MQYCFAPREMVELKYTGRCAIYKFDPDVIHILPSMYCLKRYVVVYGVQKERQCLSLIHYNATILIEKIV